MTLHVAEYGTPSTPTIVFLHGSGMSGWMWEFQKEHLKDFHCLVPDLPGHGKSNQIQWVSMQDTASQIAELIRRRANGGRAHVVGLSLGALLTTQLLASASEVIDHAVLSGLNALPITGAGIMKIVGRLTAPLLKTEFLIRSNAKMLNLPPNLYESYRESVQQLSLPSFLRINDEGMAFRLPPGLKNVQTPTLALAGERDLKLIQQSIKALAAEMPNAEARIAPGVGHGWNGEAPELFSQTVRAWLTDQPLPTELRPV